ncbi:MAG: class I SAM-dependent methyltransferase [Roseburia sp.]|nr:class I SAM-dependent methyltransferase [Roseburia sp.]
MTERLDALMSLVERADVIADVGCDHGLIAKRCADTGIAKRVIASDISEKCLEKARRNARGSDNIEFICADGLKYECDEAVIAGMGGLLICKILGEASCKPKTLVLCPHRDADSVRKAVIDMGYTVDSDRMIKERGKFYSIMRARLCETRQALSELQLHFGVYCDEKDDTLREYLSRLYNTYMRAPTSNGEKLRLVKAALTAQGVAL